MKVFRIEQGEWINFKMVAINEDFDASVEYDKQDGG